MKKRIFIVVTGSIAIIALIMLSLVSFMQEEKQLYLVHKDFKHGFINKHGKIFIPLDYEFARDFSEGLAPVMIDGKMGYINMWGDLVINAVFDNAMEFSEGKAAVQVGDQWGYISSHGNYIVEPQFSWVYPYKEGRAFVQLELNSYYGMIDENGQWIVQPTYIIPAQFHDGVAAVRDQRMNAIFIDVNGEQIWLKNLHKPIYSHSSFFEGYAVVDFGSEHPNRAYIDREGNVLQTEDYDFRGSFSEGKAMVCNFFVNGSTEQCGYINKEGKEIIPLIYDSAHDFYDGLAWVSKDGVNYIINSQGERLIQNPDGMYLWGLDRELIIVRTDEDTIGYMNRKGKVVWDPVK